MLYFTVRTVQYSTVQYKETNCLQCCCTSTCSAKVRKACYRVCARLGLKSSAVSKQTRHLAYDHTSMVAVRNCVSFLMGTENIDARLMCHFDQVWSTHYEPAKRVLFKPVEEAGVLKPEKWKPSKEKMLSSIRKALGVASDSSSKQKVCQPPVLCAQSHAATHRVSAQCSHNDYIELCGWHHGPCLHYGYPNSIAGAPMVSHTQWLSYYRAILHHGFITVRYSKCFVMFL